MKINKILILGGHGYIGKALTQKLQKHFQVYSPTKNELNLLNPTEWKDTLESFDLTINLAAKVMGLCLREKVENLFQHNVDSVQNILNYISTKYLINISSMAVYGKQSKVAIDETLLLNPQSPYGLSKKTAEELIHLHCNNRSLLKAVNLRLPGIYGAPRTSGILYHAKNKAKNNEEINLNTEGLINWECMHIDDLVASLENFIRAYAFEKDYDVFNLGYGEKMDLIETIQQIKKELKSESKITADQKGYDDFYMTNTKIKSVCQIEGSFFTSLQTYLRSE